MGLIPTIPTMECTCIQDESRSWAGCPRHGSFILDAVRNPPKQERTWSEVKAELAEYYKEILND